MYLCGDMTIKVVLAQVQFLVSGDMPVVVMTGHGVQTCRKLWFSTVAVLGSSWIDWLVFLGPCTQVHGQGFPLPSGRGRGGGDAGSLLPGVLPPN